MHMRSRFSALLFLHSCWPGWVCDTKNVMRSCRLLCTPTWRSEEQRNRFATGVLKSRVVSQDSKRWVYWTKKKGMFFLIHPWLCCYGSLCLLQSLYIWQIEGEPGSGCCYTNNNDLNQVWESRAHHIKISDKNSPHVCINLKSLSQDINKQSACVKIWNSLFCTLYLISVLSMTEPTVNLEIKATF